VEGLLGLLVFMTSVKEQAKMPLTPPAWSISELLSFIMFTSLSRTNENEENLNMNPKESQGT
jgi:hypothetical protein